jgi:thiazole synthase
MDQAGNPPRSALFAAGPDRNAGPRRKSWCAKASSCCPTSTRDPVLAKRLQDAGTATVMPLGSPIGSNRGLETRDQLRIIIDQATVPVVVDAGIGRPSHAAEAMEMGADAVLVNTAIAVSEDPCRMARCFAAAVRCGREAYEVGLGAAERTARGPPAR